MSPVSDRLGVVAMHGPFRILNGHADAPADKVWLANSARKYLSLGVKSSGDQYQLTEDTDVSVHSTTGGKLLITWSGTQTGGSGLDVFGKFVSLP